LTQKIADLETDPSRKWTVRIDVPLPFQLKSAQLPTGLRTAQAPSLAPFWFLRYMKNAEALSPDPQMTLHVVITLPSGNR
jgi:hypothetical protein